MSSLTIYKSQNRSYGKLHEFTKSLVDRLNQDQVPTVLAINEEQAKDLIRRMRLLGCTAEYKPRHVHGKLVGYDFIRLSV